MMNQYASLLRNSSKHIHSFFASKNIKSVTISSPFFITPTNQIYNINSNQKLNFSTISNNNTINNNNNNNNINNINLLNQSKLINLLKNDSNLSNLMKRSYSKNTNENNKESHNTTAEDEEKILVFEDTYTSKFKFIFVFNIAQIVFFFVLFEFYMTQGEEGNLTHTAIVGVSSVAILLSQLFSRHYAKKCIQKIYSFQKGRVLEFTTYNFYGTPLIKRTFTSSKLLAPKSNNAAIKQYVPQDLHFNLKIQGDKTFYQGNMKHCIIHNPILFDKIIHPNPPTKSI
ncbi:hypothetical protein CYY_009607 [Polysphondylium violaceum]|uniref:Transmembrane protein n=1 Tax=Polysphondylium violaceum TaxID=133409 RepID=A0A8J4PJV4_9MYCE|nr:hypothetical protein CYY_009607 [Polysphondylium violaceum]